MCFRIFESLYLRSYLWKKSKFVLLQQEGLEHFFPVQKYITRKNRLCMRKKIRPNGPTELQCYDVIKNAKYLQKTNKNAYFEDFSVLMFILFKAQFQKQLPELFCKKRCS